MTSTDMSGKIKFTMSITNHSVLEFLDLSLHINEHKKICVNIYGKSTNSFTYVYTTDLQSQKEHKQSS